VFRVRLPPLRERPADVAPLAEHLLADIGRRLGRSGLALTDGARAKVQACAWPGNVRELGNALERAAILSNEAQISESDIVGDGGTTAEAPTIDGTLKQLEREAIRRALAATGGHRKRAAERLGIGLRTLYDKLKEYDLS
jgi:two-component system response regulator FlrC